MFIIFSHKTCTFFGHRDTPKSVLPLLHDTLIHLIETQGVDLFYVGNQGSFDFMVHDELKQIKEIYPHIRYYVVLAYMPTEKKEFDLTDYSDTIYPESLENVLPGYAISKRNSLMVEWADIVVTYVRNLTGGAAKFQALAEKKGKQIINLCQRK